MKRFIIGICFLLSVVGVAEAQIPIVRPPQPSHFALSGAMPYTGPVSLTGNRTNGSDAANSLCVNKVCPVTAFGAKGDCSTDDTTDIQAAFTAVPDGGTVLFPQVAHCYVITSAITGPTDTGFIVQGNGYHSTQTNTPYANAAWLVGTNFSGSVIMQTTAGADGLHLGTGNALNVPIHVRDLMVIGAGSGGAGVTLGKNPSPGSFNGTWINVAIANFATGLLVNNTEEESFVDLHLWGNLLGLDTTPTTANNQDVYLNLQCNSDTQCAKLAGDTNAFLGGLVQNCTTSPCVEFTAGLKDKVQNFHLENSTLTSGPALKVDGVSNGISIESSTFSSGLGSWDIEVANNGTSGLPANVALRTNSASRGTHIAVGAASVLLEASVVNAALNGACTANKTPFGCCSGAAAGTCTGFQDDSADNTDFCTGSHTPAFCCTGAGTGTCTSQVAYNQLSFLSQQGGLGFNTGVIGAVSGAPIQSFSSEIFPSFGVTKYYSAAGTVIPTCTASLARQFTCVSDSTACTSGTTYTSGGSTLCLVQCNTAGSLWKETGTNCF